MSIDLFDLDVFNMLFGSLGEKWTDLSNSIGCSVSDALESGLDLFFQSDKLDKLLLKDSNVEIGGLFVS